MVSTLTNKILEKHLVDGKLAAMITDNSVMSIAPLCNATTVC